MSNRLAIVRAAHLIDYVSVLRAFGAPVDRCLARSRLPQSIEQTPDLYVSLPALVEWLAWCGRDVEPMELGFLAAQKATLASLRPAHQAAIIEAPTGFSRLEALLRVARLEDSGLRTAIRMEADQLRVFCDTEDLRGHPFICFAEWLNLQAIVSVFRSIAGHAWSPREMCFVSPYSMPKSVKSAFPESRILVGQPHTSIVIDRALLARTTGNEKPLSADCSSLLSSDNELNVQGEEWTFASLLRQIIQPYLKDGHPDLALTAEMAGMSRRTLQRRLQQNHLSYSDVLREARFDLALSLLENPDVKIIDVAMTSGYENPQHFTRAFRRATGVTPTAYRRGLLS